MSSKVPLVCFEDLPILLRSKYTETKNKFRRPKSKNIAQGFFAFCFKFGTIIKRLLLSLRILVLIDILIKNVQIISFDNMLIQLMILIYILSCLLRMQCNDVFCL